MKFSRIQFTPDLMPMDITGTDILQDTAEGRREFQFVHGPVFANIVLADEINRAPPKTQAAMLEAMQEHRVTVLGKPYKLDEPFLGPGNPESGRARRHLSAARSAARPVHVSDRARLSVGGGGDRRSPGPPRATPCRRSTRCCTRRRSSAYQHLVRRVPVPDHIYQFAVKLVRKTRPKEEAAPDWLKPLVSWGAGPRAVQYLILGGKTRAALNGQYMVRLEDIQAVAEPVLTHRMITTFAAQSEDVDARQIVRRLVAETVEAGIDNGSPAALHSRAGEVEPMRRGTGSMAVNWVSR